MTRAAKFEPFSLPRHALVERLRLVNLRLQFLLGDLESVLRGARLRRGLAWCWALTAAAGWLVLLVHLVSGWDGRLPGLLVLAGGLLAAGIVWQHESNRPPNLREVVALLEREHPQVRHLLSTAAEQEPDQTSGKFGFLQTRVIDQVLKHPDRELWAESCQRKLRSASRAQILALVFMVGTLWLGGGLKPWHLQPD